VLRERGRIGVSSRPYYTALNLLRIARNDRSQPGKTAEVAHGRDTLRY